MNAERRGECQMRMGCRVRGTESVEHRREMVGEAAGGARGCTGTEKGKESGGKVIVIFYSYIALHRARRSWLPAEDGAKNNRVFIIGGPEVG